MPGARTFGFSLLFMAAACRPTGESQAPKPLKPQDGPRAWISVGYTGGLLNRSLHAYFRTEQQAYVMVGHLGGDGRIRVLYPESPDESGFIRGKKSYQTVSTSAHYDAIPSLFSYTVSQYRGLGARFDSYDGRGHGYVFLIASRRPLRYNLLYDYAGWAELEMEGYLQHHDPRYAVRSLADALTQGADYTLKFASSSTTSHFDSYASRAWDCAVLSSLGMFGNSALWSAWQVSMLGFGMSHPLSGCGRSAFPLYASGPVFTTVVQRPTAPTGDAAPRLDRPGRRGLPGADTPTRTTLTRVSPSVPREPMRDRDSFDRNRARRPAYGSTGRAAESGAISAQSRPSDSRGSGSRASSPRETRSGSPSSGSASSTRSPDSGSSSSAGASSSSGSRSGSTSSPSERRKPDSR